MQNIYSYQFVNFTGFTLYKPSSFTYGGGDPTFLTLDGAVFNIDKPGQYILYQTEFLLVQCIIDCMEFNEKQVNVISVMSFKVLQKDFFLETYIEDGKLLISTPNPDLLVGTETKGSIVGKDTHISYEGEISK